jgi:SAM-dependent methyltransferase
MPDPASHLRASRLSVVRDAYDTVADDYAELLRDELDEKPVDRAMLAVFAELVLAAGGGRVADLGCGPGRVTDHLQRLGLDAFGIDLSPAMVAVARRTYPEPHFEVGSIDDLALPDGSLAGAVAWYSIIHTPVESLPRVFAEFARVLAEGAPLLLAFQIGDGGRHHLSEAYGHSISLDAYRPSPDAVTELLDVAGIELSSRTVRAPDQSEKTPQCYVLGRRRRPAGAPSASP